MENKLPKSDEGKTLAYWEATELLIEAKRNSHDIETDVCIIGAGIAGLTTAYLLANEGRDVTVIDDGLIGGGETCRTTAHLSQEDLVRERRKALINKLSIKKRKAAILNRNAAFF